MAYETSGTKNLDDAKYAPPVLAPEEREIWIKRIEAAVERGAVVPAVVELMKAALPFFKAAGLLVL
jgi:hypothetical protein